VIAYGYELFERFYDWGKSQGGSALSAKAKTTEVEK